MSNMIFCSSPGRVRPKISATKYNSIFLPVTNHNLRPISLIFSAALVVSAAGCAGNVQSNCEQGEAALQASQFETAAKMLSVCLTEPDLESAARRRALQVRAWAYFSLRQDGAAVRDQEASFKLERPSEYREFINYSSYLRRISRYEDSLAALHAAEAIERQSGRESMMTQYNLGWTLFELRRYDEAVRILTKATSLQPEFPFVYWRRALALEALGRTAEAKRDIEAAASAMVKGPATFPEDVFKAALREKVRQYKLDRKYSF